MLVAKISNIQHTDPVWPPRCIHAGFLFIAEMVTISIITRGFKIPLPYVPTLTQHFVGNAGFYYIHIKYNQFQWNRHDLLTAFQDAAWSFNLSPVHFILIRDCFLHSCRAFWFIGFVHFKFLLPFPPSFLLTIEKKHPTSQRQGILHLRD